ncbi:MAG: hypothetical protein U0807_00950 [Candidatus Binatia bacterium]
MCGNCRDDDDDGLTDFEDPDCCAQPASLNGTTIEILPADHVGGPARFALGAHLPPAGSADTSPLVDDVTIQVRAGASPIACANLGHLYWEGAGKTFRFRPPGRRFPPNLTSALVRVLPDGTIAVRATGARAGIDGRAGSEWQVAVRIGARCGTGSVRPRGLP